jgi:hypothetical protein
VLVVEGYMDYVSLAAHGVGNAVAPLGTAMTQEQCELIARYAPRAILLYDSDKAGLKATFRTGDELLRAGLEVLVATLPEGEDPDSLVRNKGQAALRRFLDDAVDVMERKIQILERKDFFSSIKGTRQAIDSLLPTVRAASDELVRSVYIGRISDKTGVPRETLEREVAEAAARDPRAPGPLERRRRDEGRRAEDFAQRPARKDMRTNAERSLLLLMVHDERWVEEAAKHVEADALLLPLYRTLFQGLLDAEGQRDPRASGSPASPPRCSRSSKSCAATRDRVDGAGRGVLSRERVADPGARAPRAPRRAEPRAQHRRPGAADAPPARKGAARKGDARERLPPPHGLRAGPHAELTALWQRTAGVTGEGSPTFVILSEAPYRPSPCAIL